MSKCSNLSPSGFAFNSDGCNNCSHKLNEEGKCDFGPDSEFDQPTIKYKLVGRKDKVSTSYWDH